MVKNSEIHRRKWRKVEGVKRWCNIRVELMVEIAKKGRMRVEWRVVEGVENGGEQWKECAEQ